MSFEFKERGAEWTNEEIKKVFNGLRSHIGLDKRASPYIKLINSLNEKGIKIKCRKCESYPRCHDKLSILLVGNGTMTDLLNERRKDPSIYCTHLYSNLKWLNRLYQINPDIENTYKNTIS